MTNELKLSKYEAWDFLYQELKKYVDEGLEKGYNLQDNTPLFGKYEAYRYILSFMDKVELR